MRLESEGEREIRKTDTQPERHILDLINKGDSVAKAKLPVFVIKTVVTVATSLD